MVHDDPIRADPLKLRLYNKPDVQQIPQLKALGGAAVREMQVVAAVLPFRVSNYVVDELIDWSAVPDDPVFRLLFPARAMLDDESFERMDRALSAGDVHEQRRLALSIRTAMNPHPGGQLTLNRPWLDGDQVSGLQHKYPETLLFFPQDGQTCHSYCSFCFRWPQFVADRGLQMALTDCELLVRYLSAHPEVTDLLITGGDPFTMSAVRLRRALEPLVTDALAHVTSIRFGTKALTFWPRRFLTDPDAPALLELITWLCSRGKHVAIMAHYNHWRELETETSQEATARLRGAGAVIRSQGPILSGINDDASVWRRLWRRQSELGIIPYYMFIVRDTGPKAYFDVPLARAWEIYRDAASGVSGLGRTVRGPSMSTSPGKVEVVGVAEVHGEQVFVLRFLQARNPAWCYRPFFARYDAAATWLDGLEPAFGEPEFFFESEHRAMSSARPTTIGLLPV